MLTELLLDKITRVNLELKKGLIVLVYAGRGDGLGQATYQNIFPKNYILSLNLTPY